MKFQDSSFNGLKVTVGTKSVTHPRTHAPKAICPINFFKVGGIKIKEPSGKKLVSSKQLLYVPAPDQTGFLNLVADNLPTALLRPVWC